MRESPSARRREPTRPRGAPSLSRPRDGNAAEPTPTEPLAVRPQRPAGVRRPPRAPRELQAPFRELQQRIDDLRHRAEHFVDEHVPRHVQKEAHRKGFHMVTGIVATPLVLYAGLPFTTLAAIATLVVIASMELLMARFDLSIPLLTRQLTATRRPGERFSWASIMFIVAALVILWIAPPPVAFAALAMLGFGDAFSALIGRWVGHNKLWYNPSKSWEGSTAGFLAGAIGALGLTAWYYAAVGEPYPFVAIVPIAIAGALAAAVAESIPQWEDNFSVPIASSATMLFLWLTAGLHPRFGPLINWLLGQNWPLPT